MCCASTPGACCCVCVVASCIGAFCNNTLATRPPPSPLVSQARQTLSFGGRFLLANLSSHRRTVSRITGPHPSTPSSQLGIFLSTSIPRTTSRPRRAREMATPSSPNPDDLPTSDGFLFPWVGYVNGVLTRLYSLATLLQSRNVFLHRSTAIGVTFSSSSSFTSLMNCC